MKKEQKDGCEKKLREYEKALADWVNTSLFDPLEAQIEVAMRLEAARTEYVLAVQRCTNWRTS